MSEAIYKSLKELAVLLENYTDSNLSEAKGIVHTLMTVIECTDTEIEKGAR